MRFDQQRMGATSVWVWRAFALLALVALGLALSFFVADRPLYGAAWLVITLAWGGLAGRLWNAQRRL